MVEPHRARRDAVPDVPSDRNAMKRYVLHFLLGAVVAATAAILWISYQAPPPARLQEHVPHTYQDVRRSPGHAKHVGKVACSECHGASFAPPPLEVCTKCHASVQTPLHQPSPTSHVSPPACTDCHAFGADENVKPWNCIRCHSSDQGPAPAIVAH